jgi:DNA-binding IclR family transcriptional regulator
VTREEKLLDAIDKLRPEHATVPSIAKLAGVGVASTAMTLADMTKRGEVTRHPLTDSDLFTYRRPEA